MKKSPERIEFERQLQQFAAGLPPESVVYDIGKSRIHDYASIFVGHRYLTVDCNPDAAPDIVCDIENRDESPGFGEAMMAGHYTEMRDGIIIGRDRSRALICNGVTEQCSDAAALLRGCRALLRDGGVALFGIIGPGYPLMQTTDRCRLTPQGVRDYLTAAGFRVKDIVPVERHCVPSYSLAWCEV